VVQAADPRHRSEPGFHVDLQAFQDAGKAGCDHAPRALAPRGYPRTAGFSLIHQSTRLLLIFLAYVWAKIFCGILWWGFSRRAEGWLPMKSFMILNLVFLTSLVAGAQERLLVLVNGQVAPGT